MKIKEVVIVEGKYDKIAVKSAVDATVIETSGFGIFSDKEKADLVRRLAKKRGIIVLTDSDGAGLVIRNYIRGIVRENVKHGYIPKIEGKEKRKTAPGKENLIGVEGVGKEAIIRALKAAGATIDDRPEPLRDEAVTKTDLYIMGLSGGKESAKKRKKLLTILELPDNISSNAMLEVINALYTKDEFYRLVSTSSNDTEQSIDIRNTSQPDVTT